MTQHTPSAAEVILQTLIDNLIPTLRECGIKRIHIWPDAENPTFSLQAEDGTETYVFRRGFSESLADLRAKQAEGEMLETLY